MGAFLVAPGQESESDEMTPLRNSGEAVSVTIHDSSQLEFKTLYQLAEGLPQDEKLEFDHDIYFFIPKAMGINADSYPKDLFYRSLHNYIRVKTPEVLPGEDRRSCRIDRIMPGLCQAVSSQELPANFIDDPEEGLMEIRLFGTFINDQLKILGTSRKLSIADLNARITETGDLFRAYRDVMDRALALQHEDSLDWSFFSDAFHYVDEFMSNRFEETLIDLKRSGFDVLHHMKAEFERREKKGYLQLSGTKALKDFEWDALGENFTYRMGRFKKYVSEVLYLEVKRYRRDRVFTNLAAAFGAAVAAIINSLADPNQRTSISGTFFASIRDSLPLMVVIVALVYVFKDRAKDYLKENLINWFRPWIPDYSFEIKSKDGRIIGRCQEDVGFVKRSGVPDEVVELRAFQSHVDLTMDHHEEILHYRRHVTITRSSLQGLLRNTESLKDILRFDVNAFLPKLANAYHNEFFVDRDLNLRSVRLHKAYHLNLVMRFVVSSKASGPLSENYLRVRVVMDKNGIKRLEFP